MNIDLKTAVMLLLITHIVQIVIFYQQYVTNKYLKEIKWWLFWSIAEVAAFLFIFLRGVPELHTLVIVGQNTAMALGTLFLYIGTLRFFGKRENVKVITIFMLFFVLICIYFTGIDENLIVRSIFINLYMSVFSILTALVLIRNKLSAHRSTFYILTFSFLLNGIIFGFRGVVIASGLYDVTNFFSPDPLNVLTYISGIIVSILWTFGYIVLINQRVNEEFKEQMVQYSNLANSSTALIWTSGTDKLCNYFNEPWLKFTGRTLEQEMGNGWAEGVHPDDFDRCVKTYVTAFDNQEKFEMEYRLKNAKGEYRWIIDMGTPNYNSKNEFTGYIGHCFDITDRKNDEAEVNRKVKELKELNDLMIDRELKMVELKKEINQLTKESGKPEKY